MGTANLILGDCIEEMKKLDSESIDAVISDPPYNLEFMSKKWDSIGTGQEFQKWNQKWATEALRVLKPGGFMFAMGGTRTHHRLTSGIEDAGFMIRDELAWTYMQGLPKAQDLGMLIEKNLGGEGEVVGEGSAKFFSKNNVFEQHNDEAFNKTVPTLPLAKEWQGWKTPALKPAFEPIVVAQKPCDGSITENVMKYGVGGFNIDECRIPLENGEDISVVREEEKKLDTNGQGWGFKAVTRGNEGRYPSNILMTEPCFEGKDGIVKENESPAIGYVPKVGGCGFADGGWKELQQREVYYENTSFSRFFIIPKACSSEKEENLERLEPRRLQAKAGSIAKGWKEQEVKNFHPTVKPISLMQHLIKLTTKPLYTVLDCFMGSGTTGLAALSLNRNFIGIEINEEYMVIAKARIAEEEKQQRLEI